MSYIWHLFISQLLIEKGACLAAMNSNGLDILSNLFVYKAQSNSLVVYNAVSLFVLVFRWTPLMVARSWHRNWLEEVLNTATEQPQSHPPKVHSPFLCLPLMSIVKIAQ